MSKEGKIEFVTSANGTSCGDVLAVLTSASLLPTLSVLLFPWLMPSSFTVRLKSDLMTQMFVKFLIEFPVIAVFTGAVVTSASETSAIMVTVMLSVTILLILTVNHTMARPKWKSVKEEWDRIKDKGLGWCSEGEEGTGGSKYPFLTNFRGMILYLTVFTILAVDFPIFPRRFAKTKKFGMSLMDIGTASFIFSNGIVSPEAKNRRSSLKKAVVSCIPLLVLGFGRLLAVKGTEYHEVVEEYGVHWNFFFTLAAVKIFGSIIFSVFKPESAYKAHIIVGSLYQFYLGMNYKLDLYILNPEVPRNLSLIDANREGIFSSFGYLSIYLASVYCGHVIYKKKRNTVRSVLELVGEMLQFLLVLWSTYFVLHHVLHGTPVCRRAANMSYIVWSLALNVTIMLLHVLLSLTLVVAQDLGILHGPMISYQLYVKNMKTQGKHFEAPRSESTADSSQKESEFEGETERILAGLEHSVEELEKTKSRAELEKVEQEMEGLLGRLCEEQKREEAAMDSIDTLHSLPNLASESLFYTAVCFNGLFVFLFGNLLTGLVNLSVNTELSSTTSAAAILLAYTTVVYFASFILYYFNIQLKFW